MDSPRNILRAVKAAKNILIPLHLRTDGDSVGSALACYHFFRSLNKKATVVSADPVPEFLLFLPGAKRIKVADPGSLPLEQFDLIFLTDTAGPERFSHTGRVKVPSQVILVNIDHHQSNRGFGDLNYVVANAASTAEIIYDLFRFWKVKITPEIANCLLTGIYTDTGGFLYSPTTAESHAKAADLIKRGGDRERVAESCFRSWTPKAIQLWSQILANARTRPGLAYSQITYPVLRKKVNASLEELSGIRAFAVSNLLLTIRGIRVAALFAEEKPRQIRVTLRSIGSADMGRIAERFGGGGHRNSAAFDYHGPLKEVVSKTVKMLKRAAA